MTWIDAARRHRHRFRADFLRFVVEDKRRRSPTAARLRRGVLRLAEPALYLLALPGMLLMAAVAGSYDRRSS